MTDETDLITHKNGVVADAKTGRFVSGKNNTTKITTENAPDFQRRRLERKREVMISAANEATPEDIRKAHGDLAFIAAITAAQQRKAADQADPKSTTAANFVLKETGYAEPDKLPAVDTLFESMQILRELAAFARGVPINAVDGEIVENE